MQLKKIFNLKLNFQQSFTTFSNQSSLNFLSNKPVYMYSKSVNLFKDKSFYDVINILKNQNNPYPKNAAYYNSVIHVISLQCTKNQKLIFQQRTIITSILNDITQRIKVMGTKQVISTLKLLADRPKNFKIQKNTLTNIFNKFEIRVRELIKLNQESNNNQQEAITLSDLCQLLKGLIAFKKGITILNKILNYAQIMYQKEKNNLQIKKHYLLLFQILSNNTEDTTDQMRLFLYQFLQGQYSKGTLQYQAPLLKVIVSSKFYKNYPVAHNTQWLGIYIKKYLHQIQSVQKQYSLLQKVSVFQNSISYLNHLQIHKRQEFFPLLKKVLDQIRKKIDQLIEKREDIYLKSENTNSVSTYLKIIPSYIYLLHYYQIKVLEDQGQLNEFYFQEILYLIKPIFQKVHAFLPQKLRKYAKQNQKEFIQQSLLKTKVTDNIIELILTLTNTLKDFKLISNKKDEELTFCNQLLKMYIQISQIFFQLNFDEVKYLRVLEHSALLIMQIEQAIKQNSSFSQDIIQINRKNKEVMKKMIIRYDNPDVNYKVFSIIRLNSLAKCLGVKFQFLKQKNKHIRQKKMNTYIQTLSRTMLKTYNLAQIINVCQTVSHDSSNLQEKQMGRLVFFSGKQKNLVRFWLYLHRAKFNTKIALNERIISSIVSMVHADNLQINRNNMQLLQQICIINKIKQLNTDQKSTQISDQREEEQQTQERTVKTSISSNFAILIKQGFFDYLIQQIFTFNKSVPMSFKDKFSHIQYVKTLCVASYISQEKIIFYVNRENTNSLFRYINLLAQKSLLSLKPNAHYLFGKNYSDQTLIVKTIKNVLQKYLPENKSMNRTVAFYCQFFRYFLKIDQVNQFFKNKTSVFLFAKELIEQSKLMQRNLPFQGVFAHINSNIQRLCILDIFQKEAIQKNTINQVMKNFNFVIDIKIFSNFKELIFNQIKKEVNSQQNFTEQLLKKANQDLVKKVIIQRFQSIKHLEKFKDEEILLILTQNIFCHYFTQITNHNIGLILSRIIKTSPNQIISYSWFKVIVNNLIPILLKRQENIKVGNLSYQKQISLDICQKWIINELIKYSKKISNLTQIKDIISYLNYLNFDIFSVHSKIGLNFSLNQLLMTELDVQTIFLLFQQNFLHYDKNLPELSKEKFFKYLQNSFKVYHESYVVNYYSIYFYNEGQFILNMFKSLFLMFANTMENNKQIYESINILLSQINDQIAKFKQLADLALSKKNQQKQSTHKKQKQNKSILSQKNIDFNFNTLLSGILQKMIQFKNSKDYTIQKLFSLEDLISIRRLNRKISKNQKKLISECDLNYFTGNQTLKETSFFEELSLYSQKVQNSQLTTVYYFISPSNTLWKFQNQDYRIKGSEQMIVLYLQKLLKLISQGKKSKYQLKVVKSGQNKQQYQKLL